MTNTIYKFQTYLKNQHNKQPNRRKSDRTRDHLKLAAIDVLSNIGYRKMKVLDICQKATVSSGTFYLYFENKIDITQVILEEFIAHLDNILGGPHTKRTPFDTIYQGNLEWLKSIRANAGLFRCVLQIGDESPELSELIHQLNINWYNRIANSVVRRYGISEKLEEDTILFATFSLGSMMDELARKLVIYADPNLTKLVDDIAPTDEACAEFLSLIWYRTLYGCSPSEELTADTSKILSTLHLK